MRKMDYKSNILTPQERIVFSLRELYSSFGYGQYTMSKFEEYDFYSKNKEFLVSDGIITFTDTNGKLLALKPDVTLSIVKNDPDHTPGVRKVFYDENVYRISKGSGAFREIKQTGLECIGNVDDYQLSEVLLLAAKSLEEITERFVIVVSDLDILLAFVGSISADESVKREIFKCVGEKNVHGIDELCERFSLDKGKTDRLKTLISLYGSADHVLDSLSTICGGGEPSGEIEKLKKTLSVFEGTEFEDKIQIDFSILSDFNYYNGVVFKGYISGIPDSVLSGGQYDRLMQKLKRSSSAAGFAVYLDLLDRIDTSSSRTDADVMLVYGKEYSIPDLRRAIDRFTDENKSVIALPEYDPFVKCSFVYTIENGEVKEIGTNA